MAVLATLGAGGRRRYATARRRRDDLDDADLAHPCAVVLGHEAHGLDAVLTAPSTP